jgi:two-component system, chemotaxis family, chemotaxis protein CheY
MGDAMEIVFQKQRAELLQFLPHIKARIKEWMFVEIRLTDKSDKDISAIDAAAEVLRPFKDKDGRLYICNNHEMLMMARIADMHPPEVVRQIENQMPPGSCEVHTYEPTPDGLMKLAILISYRKSVVNSSFVEIRAARRENVAMIADDDMYMRTLLKKAIGGGFTFHEAADGEKVLLMYLDLVPNILFLDIHLPNVDGRELLRNIIMVDPDAFVVMLSADSSPENVKGSLEDGAKGFLAKPWTKERLQEYITKCPTVLHAA